MVARPSTEAPPRPFGARDTLEEPAPAFDIVVIGGGINGAGIARAAALAGYSVCLLEKDDFGWGTTWRSTKLIHGGLRYLEHAEFGLVFESLRDQALLLREYPDLVRPIALLLPVYRGASHSPATVGLGLTLYDLLARGRRLPGHRRLAAQALCTVEPALEPHGLRGGFLYSDSQVAYPERLCLQTLTEAANAGAVCLNHAAVVGVLAGRERVSGVAVRDVVSGRSVEIRSRVVINAAGPWIDALLASLPRPPRRQLDGTRGAHLVVDYAGRGPMQALYAEARTDGRPFFIVPWRGRHLIGTTDTRFTGPPEAASATEADAAYLLHEANTLLPGAHLDAGAVEYGYAGVRALPACGDGAEGAITRRHLLREHAADGYAGLFSVIGGKLSTFRSLANDVLRRLGPLLGPARSRPVLAGVRQALPSPATFWLLDRVGPAAGDHLRALYGPQLPALAGLLATEPALLEPLCPHGPDMVGQAVFAAREEAALQIDDVLLRRLGSGWNVCAGLDCAERVALLLAGEHHWTINEQERQLAAFTDTVRRTFYRPAVPGSTASGGV